MTKEITKHNKILSDLLYSISVEGQSHKLKLELYLVSVEDAIQSGSIEGQRRQKAEEIADAVQWALSIIEESQTMLTSQNNIQNDLQNVVKVLS